MKVTLPSGQELSYQLARATRSMPMIWLLSEFSKWLAATPLSHIIKTANAQVIGASRPFIF